MRLYLVRHGQANNLVNDPEKGLSPAGVSEINTIAGMLAGLGISVDEVWHSSKTRAGQTAKILAESVGAAGNVNLKHGLEPNDPVDHIYREIINLDHDLLIAGHLPFLADLANLIMNGKPGHQAFVFQTGSIVCFDIEKSRVTLLFCVSPVMLKTTGEDSFRSYH